MIAYEEKYNYLIKRQGWRCAISGSDLTGCFKVDLDHYNVHNKKHNRVKFPFLIDSLLNLRAVSNAHHVGSTSKGKGWGDYRAHRAEKFLERHPRIREWCNRPDHRLFSIKK